LASLGGASPGFGPAEFALPSTSPLTPLMPADEEELYQEHILDHYEDPYHRGHVAGATHAHEDDNPLCGDVVRIELALKPDGKIDQIYFDGDGCCISQAAASMLVEHFDQHTLEEVKSFSAEDMLKLFGAKLTPNRQKCCLLSWRVLQSAIYSPTAEGLSETKNDSGNGAPKNGASR
jgi:nitrogen fixation NifU-like protein